MVILDTNVISALMRADPEPSVIEWLDRQSSVSVWTTAINVLEITFGLEVMPGGKRRSRQRRHFERILDEVLDRRIAVFDSDSAHQSALLMARRRAAGQTVDFRDTMIAGIAIVHRATLATRNTRHFGDLPTPVVDPWVSDSPH